MKRTSQPLVEPVSLAEVKAQLSISDTVQDAIITRRISEAREWAETYTQRALMDSGWEARLDAFPQEILLRYPPIISIESIQYVDTAGALQTLNPLVYSLDNYSEPGWVLLAYGQDWPETADTANAVRVNYRAGYASAADVPGPIKEAILLLVGHWMNYQKELESGGSSVVTRVPLAVEQLLTPYKVWRL